MPTDSAENSEAFKHVAPGGYSVVVRPERLEATCREYGFKVAAKSDKSATCVSPDFDLNNAGSTKLEYAFYGDQSVGLKITVLYPDSGPPPVPPGTVLFDYTPMARREVAKLAETMGAFEWTDPTGHRWKTKLWNDSQHVYIEYARQ